jgi:hypothetical protein
MANYNEISYYTGLITSEHQKTKFIKYLKAFLGYVDVNSLMSSFDDNFDIDTAVGVQLDILGELIGQERTVRFDPSDGSSPMLNDYNYRFLLKGKIIKNLWDGTMESLIKLLDFVFPATIETKNYYNVGLGLSQKLTQVKIFSMALKMENIRNTKRRLMTWLKMLMVLKRKAKTLMI